MKQEIAIALGNIAMWFMIGSAIIVWFADIELYLKVSLCYLFVIQAYNERMNINEVQ